MWTTKVREFRAVIGVDFGTTRSGYTYAFFNDKEKVFQRLNWPRQPLQVPFPKTLTTILYNPNGGVAACGYDALEQWMRLRGDKVAGWNYYQEFKMDLRSEKQPESLSKTARQAKPTVALIGDYLRWLKDLALGEVKDKTGGSIQDHEILWCLTVPAIWTDAEKNYMRAAAQWAGMISDEPSDEDRLLFALEPEAAVLYCKKESQVTLRPGHRVMVVDCGGGTADIITVEMTGDHTFKEIISGGGGPFGSIYVDRAFIKYFSEQVSDKVFDAYSKGNIVERLRDINQKWEEAKCHFDPTQQEITYFPIPVNLHRMIEKENPEILRRLMESQGIDSELHIPHDVMLQFFEQPVQGTLKEIRNQLDRLGSIRCDYMFLVGGFSSSPVLRQRIEQEFRTRVGAIVVPNLPGGAIVHGATLFGLNPRSIPSRIMRRTYGCDSAQIFREGVDPEGKRVEIDETGKIYCRDRFALFAKAGQSVGIDDGVTKEFTPISSAQETVTFNVLTTQSHTPIYSDDEGVEHLGSLEVAIPGGGLDREVKVTMYFGQTEIHVKAVDVQTGSEFATKIVYRGGR